MEETVSKLRSVPAPYLAQAPAPKLGVGVDLNRCRDRVGCLLGPDTVLTRSRSHRGADPTAPRRGRHLPEGRTVSQRDRRSTSRGCGADISLAVRAAHPTELARLLGYVSTPFPAACANASLVGILSGARLRLPGCRSLAGSPNARARPPSQVVLAIQSLAFRHGNPRAPPAHVAVAS